MKDKIVFVSHDATLSGAPILLFNILSYLEDKLPYEFVIMLGRDGPLRGQFEQLGQVVVYPELVALTGRKATVLRRLKMVSKYHDSRLKKVFDDKSIKLIFANTIVNGGLVDLLNLVSAPVITYVHELAYTIQMQSPVSIERSLSQTTLFLAGSEAVQQQLTRMGVAANKVRVMPSSVPVEALATKLAATDVAAARAELKLQANDQVLVAVGKAEWRKGSDLFVQLAKELAVQHPSIHFVWVGVQAGSQEHLQMSYDIAHLGLQSRFHLIPVTPDYLKYVALADIFVLCSREDPFPLVILEAAVAGKATVCFADTGGSPEFVGTDNGVVVPYADVAAMATSVVRLLSNATLRIAKGEHARLTAQQHYNIPIVASRIAQVLAEYAR